MPAPQDLNPLYWWSSLGEYLASRMAPGSRMQNWLQDLNQQQERAGRGLSNFLAYPFQPPPLQPPTTSPPPIVPTVKEAQTTMPAPPVGSLALAGEARPASPPPTAPDPAAQAILDLYRQVTTPQPESAFERLVRETLEASKPKPPPTDFLGALFNIKPGEGWNNVNNFLDSPIVNRLQRFSRAMTAPEQYALQQQQAENALRAQMQAENKLSAAQGLGLMLEGQGRAQQAEQARIGQQANLLQLLLEMQRFNRQLDVQQAQLAAEIAKAQRMGDLQSIQILAEAMAKLQQARLAGVNADMISGMFPPRAAPGTSVVTPSGSKVTVLE